MFEKAHDRPPASMQELERWVERKKTKGCWPKRVEATPEARRKILARKNQH
jgi:hypothetical protein